MTLTHGNGLEEKLDGIYHISDKKIGGKYAYKSLQHIISYDSTQKKWTVSVSFN